MTDLKRIYLQLDEGDKTKIANAKGCSPQHVSQITKYGGAACPLEKAIEWVAQVAESNTNVSDQAAEYFARSYRAIHAQHSPAEFEPNAAATEITQCSADVVTNLLDGEVTAADEESILRLVAAGNRALDRIHRARTGAQRPLNMSRGRVR